MNRQRRPGWTSAQPHSTTRRRCPPLHRRRGFACLRDSNPDVAPPSPHRQAPARRRRERQPTRRAIEPDDATLNGSSKFQRSAEKTETGSARSPLDVNSRPARRHALWGLVLRLSAGYKRLLSHGRSLGILSVSPVPAIAASRSLGYRSGLGGKCESEMREGAAARASPCRDERLRRR